MPACDKQIGERAGDDEAMSILYELAIAHLGEAEDPFDNPDRMLHFGPHFRFGAVFRPLDLVHDAAMAIAAVDEVLRARGMPADHRPLTAIGLIAPHAGFVPVQQLGQHRTVGDIRRRRHCRVDQLAAAVDAEMRLHAEIPLVALLCLMHLGIAGLLCILVEEGALMMVASTIVPVATFSPLAAKCRCTASNSRWPRSCASSRWRKRHTVVSSGTGSRPRSIPTKRRIASES